MLIEKKAWKVSKYWQIKYNEIKPKKHKDRTDILESAAQNIMKLSKGLILKYYKEFIKIDYIKEKSTVGLCPSKTIVDKLKSIQEKEHIPRTLVDGSMGYYEKNLFNLSTDFMLYVIIEEIKKIQKGTEQK